MRGTSDQTGPCVGHDTAPRGIRMWQGGDPDWRALRRTIPGLWHPGSFMEEGAVAEQLTETLGSALLRRWEPGTPLLLA